MPPSAEPAPPLADGDKSMMSAPEEPQPGSHLDPENLLGSQATEADAAPLEESEEAMESILSPTDDEVIMQNDESFESEADDEMSAPSGSGMDFQGANIKRRYSELNYPTSESTSRPLPKKAPVDEVQVQVNAISATSKELHDVNRKMDKAGLPRIQPDDVTEQAKSPTAYGSPRK